METGFESPALPCPESSRPSIRWALAGLSRTGAGALALLGGLAVALQLYLGGQWLLALVTLALCAAGTLIYLDPRLVPWRFLFPGLLVALLFVMVPIAYTLSLSTTNYSSQHLLSFSRATEFLLSQRYMPDRGQSHEFALLREEGRFRARLESEDGQVLVSEAFVPGRTPHPLRMARAEAGVASGLVDVAVLARLMPQLKGLVLVLPDASEAQMSGLNRFDTSRPLYLKRADGSLLNQQDGSVLHPDWKSGFYVDAQGRAVAPGFTASVGLGQFRRLLTDSGLSSPFLGIFAWTVAYSALTVGLSFVTGLLLAVLLNWEELEWRNTYRLLYYLPSAVPGMIAILIVRRMFFTNTGEINAVLDTVFGIRPEWYATPALARAMVAIVSVWLYFPYMMMLCMGLIRTIPAELYEASALAGAGPLTNLFRITLPLSARPALPLLIASFASAFNNAGLILYLTNGGPGFLDTREPIGATDLLASATFRIAFFSGSNFGLAAAISVLLFVIVAALAFTSLRLTRDKD